MEEMIKRVLAQLSESRRIVLIGVIGIVLPSALLSYFSFRLTVQVKELLGRSTQAGYSATAKLRALEIERRMRAAEERLSGSLPKTLPDLCKVLPTLPEKFPFVLESYLTDSEYQLIYPPAGPTVSSPESLDQIAANDAELRVAADLEYVKKDLRTAAALYEAIARSCSGDRQIAALLGAAGCRFKLGQYDQARDIYRSLANAAASAEVQTLARYQFILSSLSVGENPASEAIYLWHQLLKNDLPAARARFLRSELRGRLKNCISQTAFSELIALEKLREEEELYRAEFQEWVLLKLRLEAKQIERPGAFSYSVTGGFGKKPRIVSLAVLELGGKSYYAAFRLSLDWIEQNVIAPALQAPPEGTRFVVLGRRGELIFGQPGMTVTEEPFQGLENFWRLGVVEETPVASSVQTKLTILYSILTVFIFVLITFGVYLTLRDASREIELSKLKSDFVSRVSHELKTPIALIRMFAETLSMGRVKDPDKVKEYYNIITRESDRLGQLVNNLLDFSRIEAKRKTYEFAMENLSEVVSETIASYLPELESKGFEVHLDIRDGLPSCLADRSAIAQCVVNLISNAIKYSDATKEITIRVCQEDGNAIIEVSDKGIGMDEGEMKRAFERFYRGSDPRVLSTRGAGLGLAIVKHAIEAHGGRVEVASQKDRGSTFRLIIPIRTEGENDGENTDR